MTLKNADTPLKIILFVAAFLMYANTLGHDYAWDDSIVITENASVQKGIPGIPGLFLKYNSDRKSDKYGYRPIVLSSFAIEQSLFKMNPHAQHLMNVLFFALLCSVMFGVLRKIFYAFSNLAPFLIVLLFLAHPVHVEAVANIKSRDEIFALLFSLLSLGQLISYHRQRNMRSLLFSMLWFLAAFLSKESAIAFLAVMPLTLLYMDGRAAIKKIAASSVGIALLLIISLVILKLSTGSTLGKNAFAGAGVYYESNHLGNSFFYISVFSTKLADAFTILLMYMKNFFFPVTQLYYYGYNQVPVASWGQPWVIMSCLLHLGLLTFAILYRKKQAQISYGILFYFITISVFTHVVINLSDTMADRFLFAPSLGLCIAFIFTLGALLRSDLKTLTVETLSGLAKEKLSAGSTRLRAIVLIVVVLLCIKTVARNKAWKNNATLATTDMPKLENCSRAHFFYANTLAAKLRTTYDAGTEAEMIAHYKKSYRISNEAYYAYMALGTYLCNAKKFSEGMAVLDSMLLIYPNQADPNFYMGRACFETKNYPKAIACLERSKQLAPAVMTTWYFLALAYSGNGDYTAALATTDELRKRFGDQSSVYEALGRIYFDKGDLEQSTKNTLEQLRFNVPADQVYGTVIGRYQSKKQDSLAAVYYRLAQQKGLFKNGR